MERLALPAEVHHRVAVLLVEAVSQWCVQSDGKGVMAVSRFFSCLSGGTCIHWHSLDFLLCRFPVCCGW